MTNNLYDAVMDYLQYDVEAEAKRLTDQVKAQMPDTPDFTEAIQAVLKSA